MVGSSSSRVEILLEEEFFTACSAHDKRANKKTKKNEKNIFCLNCCTALCSQCLCHHHLHSFLQIRRYMYHDVIRITDAKKLNLDCSSVQSYRTNSAKVVFLKQQRPISSSSSTRPVRVSSSWNICIKCDKPLRLHHPYLFCSISCKVRHHHGISQEEEPKRVVLLDRMTTPESILDSSESITNNTIIGDGVIIRISTEESCETLIRTKKRSSSSENYERPHYGIYNTPVKSSPTVDVNAGANRRRKGVPQRSPLK